MYAIHLCFHPNQTKVIMTEKPYTEQLLRLQEEQKKALQDTGDQINQWLKFRSDYDALKKRLYSLPDQVSHDVMVPFGKMAFMPGQLVHTNEILVLLGDNWFTERSAKQAAEIVDRRINAVDKQLEELKKQRQLLEPRQQFTSELQQISKEGGDVMEIREEYDEEKERQWKEIHRKHVREYRSRLIKEAEKQPSSQPLSETRKSGQADEELWARLDQLENIECERKEIIKIGTEAEKKLEGYKYPAFSLSSEKQKVTSTRAVASTNTAAESDTSTHAVARTSAVAESDTEDEESSYTASDELDSDDDDKLVEDNEEEIVSKGTLITFSHSQNAGNGHSPESESSKEDPTGISPGDIYSRYIRGLKPKSILKKSPSGPKKKVRHKTKTPVVAFDTGSDDEQIKRQNFPVKQSGESAFSGTVVEKSASDLSTLPKQTVSQRPVSKFKARTTNPSKDLKESQPDVTNENDSSSVKPVSKFKAQRQVIKR